MANESETNHSSAIVALLMDEEFNFYKRAFLNKARQIPQEKLLKISEQTGIPVNEIKDAITSAWTGTK